MRKHTESFVRIVVLALQTIFATIMQVFLRKMSGNTNIAFF